MLQYGDTIKSRVLFFPTSHRFKSEISITHVFEAVYMMNRQRLCQKRKESKNKYRLLQFFHHNDSEHSLQRPVVKWGIDTSEIKMDGVQRPACLRLTGTEVNSSCLAPIILTKTSR